MRACFHDDYEIPLPEGHPSRCGSSRGGAHSLAEGLVASADLVEPTEIAWEDLELVHDASYMAKLRRETSIGSKNDDLASRGARPWSEIEAGRERHRLGGLAVLEDGVAANLAGGTHHACPDHGEGFCVLNDVGVAIRILQREEEVERALIVDLDVHQGNANALCFAGDASVFTYSIHGERNFPMKKAAERSPTCLADHVGDVGVSRPPRADPDRGDRGRGGGHRLPAFGRGRGGRRSLRTTRPQGGLRRRERLAQTLLRDRIPVVLVLSGGYAEPHG